MIGTLHSLFEMARRDRLIAQNPCDLIDVPTSRASQDIRFLALDELERVLEASPPSDAWRAERDWWPVVRLLLLTAAMTGMRLGELRALRWQDLDMAAMKVRVRQSYVLGQYGTPKSRRSARAIPLASRLVAELDEHHRTTRGTRTPTWCSRTLTPAGRWTVSGCSSTSRRRCAERTCGPSASTT